jgi:hypothetical protein
MGYRLPARGSPHARSVSVDIRIEAPDWPSALSASFGRQPDTTVTNGPEHLAALLPRPAKATEVPVDWVPVVALSADAMTSEAVRRHSAVRPLVLDGDC